MIKVIRKREHICFPKKINNLKSNHNLILYFGDKTQFIPHRYAFQYGS